MAVEAQPIHRFQYELQKPAWVSAPWGMSLVFDASKGIYVGRLEPGGYVDTKNSILGEVPQLVDQQLRHGDFIECVNGYRSEDAIKEQLRTQSVVHIAVWRPMRRPMCWPMCWSPTSQVNMNTMLGILKEGGQLVAVRPYTAVGEPTTGYLPLKRDDIVEIVGGSVEGGEPDNLHPLYAYGSIVMKSDHKEGPKSPAEQGWFPIAILGLQQRFSEF